MIPAKFSIAGMKKISTIIGNYKLFRIKGILWFHRFIQI